MKIALVLSLLILAVTPRSGTAEIASAAAADVLKVRTTAYTATEPNGGGHRSAVGTRLRYGGAIYSAASDWSWLPLGTVFRMKETGRTYLIEDYGSALVGRKTVDLYMLSDRKMRAWGVRQVNIEIIKWGCFDKSLTVLKPRQRHRHVRRMVHALHQRKAGGALLAGGPQSPGNASVQ
jgi:3D (Asp-Asp-Asp) domain-containing protein